VDDLEPDATARPFAKWHAPGTFPARAYSFSTSDLAHLFSWYQDENEPPPAPPPRALEVGDFSVPGDVEAPPPPVGPGGGDSSMESFFADVATVKAILEKTRKSLVKLQAAHEESKTVTRSETMKTLRAAMNAIIEDVSVVAREAKLRLENLDLANESARSASGAGVGSSNERTRSAITSSLKMKLKTQMAEFQDLRAKLTSEYKEVVERRYFAVAGTTPDQETLDHLVETGESETIFQKAIMEQGRGQILDTVAEIQERHDAVRELERKLLELHQIFLDMSVLVEAQGEMLDNIETQVSKSVDFVQRGNVALVAARNYQRSSRKWMCCSIIFVLIIACAILLPVLQPWADGSARRRLLML
jgi:syntaxin 1B/2/3